MTYVDNFKTYLHTDKNAAPSTIAAYMTNITQFIEFNGQSVDVLQAQPLHVRSFISHLSYLGQKRSSINRALCALKSFYRYLRDIEKAITSVPTDEIKTTKKEKTLPKNISEDNVQAILRAASETSTRDRLLTELLYGSGGRVSEVISLKVEDIDFDESFITILGKGDKERSVPVHESCVELVKLHMRESGILTGYLFPLRGNGARHMTREAVGKVVKRLACMAGVDPNKVSPHVFRHSFATHMLENGCDMAQVQDLLGHADIATTRIYARVTKTSKRRSYEQCHPLASKPL